MSIPQTRPDPTDSDARARKLAGSAITLTAMGFLAVAFSFDANAARPAGAESATAAMSAFSRVQPIPESAVPAAPSLHPAVEPIPVPVPGAVSTIGAPAAEAVPGATTRNGPRAASKPRAPRKQTHKAPGPRKAKLRPASPEDAELVEHAIATRMTALGRCYERALLRSPGLSGKMQVRVEVAPDGRVTTVKVRRSSVHDSWLEGCVEQRIAGWRLPHLNDGSPVRVTIPVSFVR